jgi:tripartite ATP-independent transporter DctM subunit
MITGILTAGFGTLVLAGVPFAIAIAAVTIGAITAADMEPAFFAQQLIAGSQSFSLLAIPLFMLAGELMTAGGMSQRLIDVANSLVRHRVPLLERASWADLRHALNRGKWALLSPVLVLGGIYGGVFTPTEAAAMSCVYALVIGLFVERRLAPAMLPELFLKAARISAMVTAIIAVSAGFGVLVAQERIAVDFAAWLAANVEQKWIALAGLNLVFFLLAAVMDEIAIMVVLGPLLIAIGQRFGVDPIHLGAIIVTNVAIGMAAPPIGYCLFVGMAISGLPLGKIARAIWPQILVMLVILFLTTYVPQFALMFQPGR